MSEDRILRERIIALQEGLDSGQSEPEAGSISDLVQTVDLGSYPTIANAWYAVVPVTVGGTPTEGAAATYAGGVAEDAFFAANVGNQVPPVGTRAVADRVDGGWVFKYNG